MITNPNQIQVFGSVNEIINRFSGMDFLRVYNDAETISGELTEPANVQKNYIWSNILNASPDT